MAKIGIGVGEEFPLDESAPPAPPSAGSGGEERCDRGWHGHGHRHGGVHFALHVLFRIAVIGLIVSLIVRLFRPRFYAPLYAPYGFYPYTYHFGFFFPGLLIAALLFMMLSRGGRCGHGWWHRGHRRGQGEEN